MGKPLCNNTIGVDIFQDSYVQMYGTRYVNSSVIQTLCVEAGRSAKK